MKKTELNKRRIAIQKRHLKAIKKSASRLIASKKKSTKKAAPARKRASKKK